MGAKSIFKVLSVGDVVFSSDDGHPKKSQSFILMALIPPDHFCSYAEQKEIEGE